MSTPTVVTALAILPLVLLTVWTVRMAVAPPALTAGRHRLADYADSVELYRPGGAGRRPVGPRATPVVSGGPLTEEERRARMVPVPAPEPAWRTDETAIMTAGHDDRPASPVSLNLAETVVLAVPADPAADVWDEAQRERWARAQVAAAGKSWGTHTAKFSGAVVPREVTPEQWFGVPRDETRELAKLALTP
jgi:hypothetical protein